MQTYKNLFLERKKYFELYVEKQKVQVDVIIDYFDNLRIEEFKFQIRWDELIKDLKK